MKINKKAIVIGGSKGIGKSISTELKKILSSVLECSSKDVDTSNLSKVKKFIKKNKSVDILILNTGGPPAKDFYKIEEVEWYKYFNQIFLSFALMLQQFKIKKYGYVFLISSSIVKEPASGLDISSSLRSGFVTLMKSVSRHPSNKKICFINIAPGPFKTTRLKKLVKNIRDYEKKLPSGKIGDPAEIGKFIKFIVENKIKYINGSTIYFDGNINNSII
jgi:3-oxoacyl-[acyl-carrier protein] reductase